jgi:hypothetical protein
MKPADIRAMTIDQIDDEVLKLKCGAILRD